MTAVYPDLVTTGGFGTVSLAETILGSGDAVGAGEMGSGAVSDGVVGVVGCVPWIYKELKFNLCTSVDRNHK